MNILINIMQGLRVNDYLSCTLTTVFRLQMNGNNLLSLISVFLYIAK